ncbi:unnamed protein product [Tilletia controversa]|nr:hypothetical protein CF328_g7299 [Tilletia controversa]CAD6930918.1 unnamed protein product [Tilletia controversa]CAD6954720.1 unnamed protein product [Tilletia controversa]CAD6956118.1 unnamed protein product [Tilletia controversa]CAD6979184.1 unnamed protein product [Tilletia controversa]
MDETPVKNALIRIIAFGACNSSRAGDKPSYAKAASIVTLRYTTSHPFNPSTDEAVRVAVRDLVATGTPRYEHCNTQYYDAVDLVCSAAVLQHTPALDVVDEVSDGHDSDTTSNTSPTSSTSSNSTTNSTSSKGSNSTTGAPDTAAASNNPLALRDPPGFAQRRLGSMLRLQAEGFEDPELRREAHEYCDLYDGPGGTNRLIAAASQ